MQVICRWCASRASTAISSSRASSSTVCSSRPHEDFATYPRTFERDCELLAAGGCDIVFAPSDGEVYPEAQDFTVHPPPALADILEGQSRPGFFTGVCTVVLKFFNMVQPAAAVFGKKDYQQLLVVRNMVRQLALPIDIVPAETVRDATGLALSSRNGYLSDAQRTEAAQLHAVLSRLIDAARSGRTDWWLPRARRARRLERTRLAAGLRGDQAAQRSARSRRRASHWSHSRPPSSAARGSSIIWSFERTGATRPSATVLQQSIQTIEVVDDAPVAATLLDLAAPLVQPSEVQPRVEVVGAQLGHVERNDVEALEVERDVADVTLGELLLHVREDQDLLARGVFLVQELDRLQQSAGDIGVGAGGD